MIEEALKAKSEEVCSEVGDRWDTWKDRRADKEEIWHECLTNYLVHIDETKFENWPWRSKVADTFSQETADTIASALRNALFPVTEQFFEIVGEDRLGKAHTREMYDYLDKQLHRMKFIERLNPWFKQLAVIGNGPILLPWTTDERMQRQRVKEIDPITGETRVTVKDVSTKRYDGPGLQVLDAVDVVFDPAVMAWSNTPFIRRVKLSPEQVLARFTGVDLSELDEKASAAPQEETDKWKVDRAKVFGIDDPAQNPSADEDDGSIEVLEYYGDFVCDGTTYKDYQLAVLNRKILAEAKRNPYWAGRPMLWGTYDDLWFTALGKGPLEPVRGTQQLIDTFSNQKADILNLIINGCFAYVDDGIIDPETMYLSPRGGIEVGALQNIKELHPNQNVALAYQEIEMLRARGERSSGASRFSMGQAPGGRRTAFEASIVNQGGSSRSMDVTKHLANDTLETILEFYVGCIQQFKWDERNTEDGLPEEALLGKYRVNYLGADLTAMQSFRQQQLALFSQFAMQVPTVLEPVDIMKLSKKVLRIFNMDDPDIMKPKAQYDKEQEQKRQMALAEAQGQTAPGIPGEMGPGEVGPVSEEEAAMHAGAGA